MQKDSIAVALAGVLAGSILTVLLLINFQAPDVLLSWANKNPIPIATVFSALVGFAGVALTTRAGFKNLIASQEAQSRRDRDARAEHFAVANQDRDEQRLFHKKTVAAAIHGELIGLLGRVHEYNRIFLTQEVILKSISMKYGNNADYSFISPTYNLPVFRENISNLGVLGASIVADVVEVLSRAQTKPPTDPIKMNPESLCSLYRSLSESYSAWGDEIVHVGARLLSIQGNVEDPGTLYSFREAKKNQSSHKS